MRSPVGELDAEARHRTRLRGIALMCGAVLCFTGIDTIGKFLIHYMDISQVVWGRYAFAFLGALFLFNPVSKPNLMRTGRLWLQIGRSVLVLASTGLNLMGLRYLQLDQAITILFATPFLVAALAVPLLGERVGPRRWAAICVGFLGVLIITRPGYGGIHPAAILSLLATGCYAVYIITTRLLSSVDSSETTLFYSNLVGAIVMSIILPLVWTWPDNPFHFVLLVVMGAVAAFGHYLLIVAHRLAPASVLAPFIYTQLIWAIVSGYLVFADLPNRWTLAGAVVVIASGLYLLYRERKVKGDVAPVSADPVA